MARAPPQTQAAAGDFKGIASQLMPEVIEDLTKEHEREVNELFEEQIQIREELGRIVTLMQEEILPREKSMHDMIEKLHQAHELATNQMMNHMGNHLEKGLGNHNEDRKQLLDPLQAMEEELKRIATLLGHEIVAPEIAGWQAPGRKPPASQARPKAAASPSSPSPTGVARMMQAPPRSPTQAAPRTASPKPSAGAGQRTGPPPGQRVF